MWVHTQMFLVACGRVNIDPNSDVSGSCTAAHSDVSGGMWES